MIILTIFIYFIVLYFYIQKCLTSKKCVFYENLNDFYISVFWGIISFFISFILIIIISIFINSIPDKIYNLVWIISFIIPFPYIAIYTFLANRKNSVFDIFMVLVIKITLAVVVFGIFSLALVFIFAGLSTDEKNKKKYNFGNILRILAGIALLFCTIEAVENISILVRRPVLIEWKDYLKFKL